MNTWEPPVVGLMPAAGYAGRLGALPCSKEIFPLGFQSMDGIRRPRPACFRLLEGFHAAGIEQAWILLRKGKWDIPTLLGSKFGDGPHLAYLTLDPTASAPETLDAAYPFVRDHRIALGFPDILFEPKDAYRHLLERLDNPSADTGSADIVLGLFPTDRCEKTDMVELEPGGGRVRRLVIKEPDRGLEHTWSIAVWTPRFTRYLHDAVADHGGRSGSEFFVGDVIQSAIDDGLVVDSVTFSEGSYLDIGTPEDLENALLL